MWGESLGVVVWSWVVVFLGVGGSGLGMEVVGDSGAPGLVVVARPLTCWR